jgi:PPE family
MRWRGLTHKQLYQLLHDGPGAAASAEPARRWQEIATSLSEIGQDLRKSLEQSGARWSGKAAGSAYDRLSITAAWATDTSASAVEMRAAVENQAEHLARARADMPAPEDVPTAQPDPTATAAVQVAQAQTDLETAEAAASSAEERAFEVMAAYEQSTSTNTSAMATFSPPEQLLLQSDVRRGGGLNVQETGTAGYEGYDGPRHDNHRPRHHGNPHWSQNSTNPAAHWGEQNQRGFLTTQPTAGTGGGGGGPSYFAGAATPRRRETDQERFTNRPTSGAAPGNSFGASPSNTTQPRASMSNVALPPDMQAAAASQAAAAAQHAGAPMAPAAGTGAAGLQQDRMAMRRFGMEAIGSNQWFGEVEEPVVGQSPRRRRDFRENEEVTESVSILDEEHQLPPNVIGDGSSTR